MHINSTSSKRKKKKERGGGEKILGLYKTIY